MFEIEYKGGNTVTLTTKKANLVFDPKMSVFGLKDLEVNGAVELLTEPRFSVNNSNVKLQIGVPGEFGVGDCDIKGIAARRNLDADDVPAGSVIYSILIGDNRVAIFGNVFEKLSDDQLEEVGIVDIMIVPVGGNGYTLDAHGAANLVRKVDPKVVIPVHYADSKLSYEVNQDDLDLFVKELGAPVETVSKYKVKPGMVYPTSLTVVVVERS